MEQRRVLLLGGSSEGRLLATAFDAMPDLRVVNSLAGLTSRPARLRGEVRVGGFGGVEGLVSYLDDANIDLVVDATHPFATQMHHHAAAACDRTGVPRLRVERPAWEPGPGDNWAEVPSIAEAARAVTGSGAGRIFVTTGRTDLAAFAPAVDGRRWWLVRAVEAPEPLVVGPAEVLIERGPFRLEGELTLLDRHRVDLVVTKNSGGSAAAPKLEASRRLGIRVVMVRRPPAPRGVTVTSTGAATAWVTAHLR